MIQWKWLLSVCGMMMAFALSAQADLYESWFGDLNYTRENGEIVRVVGSANFKGYCGRLFEDWSGRLQIVREDGVAFMVFGGSFFKDYCGNQFIDTSGDLHRVLPNGSTERVEFSNRVRSVRR